MKIRSVRGYIKLIRTIIWACVLIVVAYRHASHEDHSYNETAADAARESSKFTAYDASSACYVLFSPDDEVMDHLLQLIHAETRQILIAAYRLTDREIAGALHDAHQRGVRIEIVADQGGISQQYSKLLSLAKSGIPVYVYPPVESAAYKVGAVQPLMHYKTMIFSTALNGGPALWTGSFNFTQSAQRLNQENVIVTTQACVLERYRKQFDRLRAQSTRLRID